MGKPNAISARNNILPLTNLGQAVYNEYSYMQPRERENRRYCIVEREGYKRE